MSSITRVLHPRNVLSVLILSLGLASILQPGEASNSATVASTPQQVPAVSTQEIPSSPDAEPLRKRRVRRPAQNKKRARAAVPLRPRRGRLKLAWPVSHTITSRYGRRGAVFHHGIDIDCGLKEKIRTAQRGRVTVVDHNKIYGWFVMVRHPGRARTLYAHLRRPTVRTGQRIGPDRVVGICGNSGMSTGSHLHFEVYVGPKTVDPLKVLPRTGRPAR